MNKYDEISGIIERLWLSLLHLLRGWRPSSTLQLQRQHRWVDKNVFTTWWPNQQPFQLTCILRSRCPLLEIVPRCLGDLRKISTVIGIYSSSSHRRGYGSIGSISVYYDSETSERAMQAIFAYQRVRYSVYFLLFLMPFFYITYSRDQTF